MRPVVPRDRALDHFAKRFRREPRSARRICVASNISRAIRQRRARRIQNRVERNDEVNQTFSAPIRTTRSSSRGLASRRRAHRVTDFDRGSLRRELRVSLELDPCAVRTDYELLAWRKDCQIATLNLTSPASSSARHNPQRDHQRFVSNFSCSTPATALSARRRPTRRPSRVKVNGPPRTPRVDRSRFAPRARCRARARRRIGCSVLPAMHALYTCRIAAARLDAFRVMKLAARAASRRIRVVARIGRGGAVRAHATQKRGLRRGDVAAGVVARIGDLRGGSLLIRVNVRSRRTSGRDATHDTSEAQIARETHDRLAFSAVRHADP